MRIKAEVIIHKVKLEVRTEMFASPNLARNISSVNSSAHESSFCWHSSTSGEKDKVGKVTVAAKTKASSWSELHGCWLYWRTGIITTLKMWFEMSSPFESPVTHITSPPNGFSVNTSVDNRARPWRAIACSFVGVRSRSDGEGDGDGDVDLIVSRWFLTSQRYPTNPPSSIPTNIAPNVINQSPVVSLQLVVSSTWTLSPPPLRLFWLLPLLLAIFVYNLRSQSNLFWEPHTLAFTPIHQSIFTLFFLSSPLLSSSSLTNPRKRN